jgi:membrane protease subunit HflK
MHRAYHPEHHHHHHHRRPRLLPLLPWIVAAWLASGLYSVKTNEVAVVRRCGRVLPQVRAPGLHLGWPWPLDRVDKLQMFERKRVVVGAGATDRELGRQTDPLQAERLTGDRNLVLVSAVVQYRIQDAPAYLFKTVDVPKLIESLASSALSAVITGMKVDDVFTVERIAVQDDVLGMTEKLLAPYGTGVQVTAVSLEEVAPPAEVAEAFRDVTAAREDQQRLIHEADAYANSQAELVKGDVDRLRLDAEGFAAETTQKAQGDADRFTRVAAQLSLARELTVRRLILETLEEVLPRMKKVVIDARAAGGLDLGLIEEEP